MNLPPVLAERFSVVEELGSGGEGFVLRVCDAAGAEFVVKLYHRNLSFDVKASSLLAGADPAHVVGVIDSGESADGSRFEVLEWCEHGSLRDLLNGGVRLDLVSVVTELATALEHIHGLHLDDDPDARLVHQDLKPDNVMVRTLEPFDLVLGDFGLARMIAGSRHYTNRQQGSRAWAPPSGEAVSPGWDWWSLGMVVAEVAGGRHPFCVGGEWMSDAAISDHLSQGPVDLSDITDDRVRALCGGLLTRRTADRWGASEVSRWLAGETVRVVADAGGAERRRRSVLFNGTEYSEPAELALALQQDWDRAQEQVVQRTDGGALSQQVALLLSAAGLTDAEGLLKDTSDPPTRLANLLAEMNPDLPPVYRGFDIRPAALLVELTDPNRATTTVELIEHAKAGLISTGVMTSWRHLEGMTDAPAVQQRMHEAQVFLNNHTGTLKPLTESDTTTVKAATYAAATHPESVETTRQALEATDTTAAQQQTWWNQLAADTNPYATVLALLTEPHAREQTNQQQEEARAEAEAAERKREADARAAEDAREERERERQQRERSERRANTVTRWRRWSIPLLCAGALTTWLGVGLLVFVYGDKQESLVPLLDWPFGWNWVSAVYTWWFDGAGESTRTLDWIFGLEPGGTLSLRAGIGLAAAGGTGLILSLMAYKGGGLDDTGRLRVSVRLLRVAVFVVALAGSYAFLPWAFVAVAGLIAAAMIVVGVIAGIALVIFTIGVMLSGS